MRSFEDALCEIKSIIEKLEGGNLSLEESLTVFEKGVELITLCHRRLNEVQKKVEILVEGANSEVLRKEFDLEE
jgi:exodeoxyribonuclease VII small subunit